MKVLLCTLPSEGQYRSWIHPMLVEPAAVKYIPLGLISLASNIKGHEVKILDPFSEGWDIKETAEKINSENADVVGFSAESRRVYALYELLRLVKAPLKIAGGPHCTYHAQQLIDRGANAVFVGPLADRELQTWLDRLQKPLYFTPKQIIQCNSPLADLNYPDRRLIDYNKYFFEGKVLFEAKKRMVMFTSIGCPHGCKFCSVQSRKIQRKQPKKVVEEMIYLKSLGAESLHFLDDNYNVSSSYVSQILDEMDKQKWDMEWSMRGQVKFDYTLIPRMKDHGLKRFHVGIEALDDSLLTWLGKKHKYSDVIKVCEEMNKSNVDILAYFMLGIGESEEYIKDMPKKIKDLGIRHPYINILFPEPDTSYGDQQAKSIWDKYMKNPTPDFVLPLPLPIRAIESAEEIVKAFI